jgi:hypothetical protein
MTKVYLHYRDDSGQSVNEEREFVRVPAVGEYVTTGSNAHRVYLIVHCPFEGAQYPVEVYTAPVGSLTDALEARKPLP